ncbi:MAG: CBS domain-containing protein [Thermodesulfobacteriota bacterium]
MKESVDLILTHARADFDAFASMLLASRLFPQALPILPGTTIYRLRELMSLYRDVADFKNNGYLKKLKNPIPGRVTVVDTKKRGQLREFASWLEKAIEVYIFDHHPPTSDDYTIGALEHFPFGANTTGLYFKLVAEGLSLSPQEATIVLLGIYADTGNLTYPGTTSEDALAVSELLRRKADLSVVNQYLRPFFDPAQRQIFQDMLTMARELDLEGYRVVLIKQRLEKVIHGLSILVAQASDMMGADAILGVFAAEDKPGVQILLQSLVPEINAGHMARRFNGGGHAGAAAVFLPQADLDHATETLMTLLTEAPLPRTKVRDLMSTDLFLLAPDLPVEEAARRLESQGIHGAPVVSQTLELIGVFSRRDVEKARLANLTHAPVSAFMSTHKLQTVTPDTPLVAARKIISLNDVGRLPVLEGNRLVGIISRSDILNERKAPLDKASHERETPLPS